MHSFICIVCVCLQQTSGVDFSRAGCETLLDIPDIRVDVTAFGAIPNDGIDDSAAVNRAIESIASTGGTVFIPKGKWTIEQVIHLRSNHTRLTGDPRGGTEFHCPKTLADIYGEDPNWSWSGGFVRMSPSGPPQELGKIVGSFDDASTSVTVEWAGTMPSIGEWVQVWWFNDTGVDSLFKWLYGAEVPPSKYGKELQRSTARRIVTWLRVTAVAETSVSFASPLPLPVRPEWNTVVMRVPHVYGSSISNLSFTFNAYPYPGHLKERGNNAIACNAVVECVLTNISIHNGDSGIFIGGSGFTTVKGIKITGRYMHHPISVSSSSHCLIEDFEILALHRHGTTISWASHFNVFNNGIGADLAMDSHRACSFRNLHKNIVILCSENPKQPLRSGGAYDRGLHSARENAYVNIEFQFQGDGQPFQIKLLNEWPLCYFSHWHGNRLIEMKPAFKQQTITNLNEQFTESY